MLSGWKKKLYFIDNNLIIKYNENIMKRKKPELNFLEISFIKKTVSVRKAFGLSQKQVARKAGVTTGFIAQFESFHHRPTENVVKKIAKGLNYQGLIEEFNEIKKEEKIGDSNFLIVLPLVKQLIKKPEDIKNKKIGLFTLPYFDSVLNRLNNVYAYKVNDTLLSPDISEIDTVIVKYTDELEFTDVPDDSFIVAAKESDTIIVKIRKYGDIVVSDKNALGEGFLLKEENWKLKGVVVATVSQKILPAVELFIKNK